VRGHATALFSAGELEVPSQQLVGFESDGTAGRPELWRALEIDLQMVIASRPARAVARRDRLANAGQSLEKPHESLLLV